MSTFVDSGRGQYAPSKLVKRRHLSTVSTVEMGYYTAIDYTNIILVYEMITPFIILN